MASQTLIFWSAARPLPLPEEELARELFWGEEVEGLDDLPIRQILDRLKEVFPRHVEKTGQLQVQGEEGTFEATWTWQSVRVDCRDLGEAEMGRLCETMESLGCRGHRLPGPRF